VEKENKANAFVKSSCYGTIMKLPLFLCDLMFSILSSIAEITFFVKGHFVKSAELVLTTLFKTFVGNHPLLGKEMFVEKSY
jgi:hypothetical protein